MMYISFFHNTAIRMPSKRWTFSRRNLWADVATQLHFALPFLIQIRLNGGTRSFNGKAFSCNGGRITWTAWNHGVQCWITNWILVINSRWEGLRVIEGTPMSNQSYSIADCFLWNSNCEDCDGMTWHPRRCLKRLKKSICVLPRLYSAVWNTICFMSKILAGLHLLQLTIQILSTATSLSQDCQGIFVANCRMPPVAKFTAPRP